MYSGIFFSTLKIHHIVVDVKWMANSIVRETPIIDMDHEVI